MAPHLTPTKKARIWQYHSDGQSNRQIATKLGWDRRTINLMKRAPYPLLYHTQTWSPSITCPV